MKTGRCGEPEKASRTCCATSGHDIEQDRQDSSEPETDVVVKRGERASFATKGQGIGSAAFWIKYGRPIASRLVCYLYNTSTPAAFLSSPHYDDDDDDGDSDVATICHEACSSLILQ